jgi:hypothetical protein
MGIGAVCVGLLAVFAACLVLGRLFGPRGRADLYAPSHWLVLPSEAPTPEPSLAPLGGRMAAWPYAPVRNGSWDQGRGGWSAITAAVTAVVLAADLSMAAAPLPQPEPRLVVHAAHHDLGPNAVLPASWLAFDDLPIDVVAASPPRHDALPDHLLSPWWHAPQPDADMIYI